MILINQEVKIEKGIWHVDDILQIERSKRHMRERLRGENSI